jgi:hypothetical protein
MVHRDFAVLGLQTGVLKTWRLAFIFPLSSTHTHTHTHTDTHTHRQMCAF